MKKENGFWVDENGNVWDCEIWKTYEAAQTASASLQNCTSCENCTFCTNCTNCVECNYCDHCSDCANCIECSYCVSCELCTECRHCKYCTDCDDCIECGDCDGCIQCNYCMCFPENPQRIVGKVVEEDTAPPIVYWVDKGDEQCFIGDLCKGALWEFEELVQEEYKDNPEQYKAYMRFISAVRMYQECMDVKEN